MKYEVTYRWYNTDTFSTNIVIAVSEKVVRDHYEAKGCWIIGLHKASASELALAEKKGMPIVNLVDPVGKLKKSRTATGKTRRVALYAPMKGWNFTRAIWVDELGTEFVRINNCPFELTSVREKAEFSEVDSW